MQQTPGSTGSKHFKLLLWFSEVIHILSHNMKWISGNSYPLGQCSLLKSCLSVPPPLILCSHMHKLVRHGDLMFATKRIMLKYCIHHVPQDLDNLSNSSLLTLSFTLPLALLDKALAQREGSLQICCFPCDERDSSSYWVVLWFTCLQVQGEAFSCWRYFSCPNSHSSWSPGKLCELDWSSCWLASAASCYFIEYVQ